MKMYKNNNNDIFEFKVQCNPLKNERLISEISLSFSVPYDVNDCN